MVTYVRADRVEAATALAGIGLDPIVKDEDLSRYIL